MIMFFVVIAGIMWNPPDRADRGMPPSERPVATIQVSLHSSIPKEGAPPEKDVGTPTDNGAAIAAPRAVTVTIMVDKELLADTEKDATILQIVSLMHETSERFSHNFGISFFYTVVPWDYLPGDIEVDIHNALDDVERQWTVQMSDITVAVTKKGLYHETCSKAETQLPCQKSYKGGIARVLGNSAIVSMHMVTFHAFLHELGHVFGAIHPDTDIPSVMSSTYSLVDYFDENNKAIIMKYRERVFRPKNIP